MLQFLLSLKAPVARYVTDAMSGAEIMPTPSKRTPAVEEKILAALSNGQTLTSVCKEIDLHPTTWNDWCAADETLGIAHARARAAGFDVIAEETLRIADDGSNDYMDTEHGRRLDAEHVQRSKLRVDTRLKLLAKWDPKRYGERTTTELTGANGGPVDITDTAAAAKIAALLEAAKARKG